MHLRDQVAIVTGAASGIGLSIARRFIMEGASVAIADLDITGARRAVKEMENLGGRTLALEMDVTDEEAVNQGVDKVVEVFGGVDLLVSNAGVQHLDRLENLSFRDWKRLLAVHLDGAFLTTRACLRHMYATGKGGGIIYIGSVHSKDASPLKGPYVVAKHGLLGLCRTVAKEGAEYHVRANVICPGFVRTPLIDKQIPMLAKDFGISEERVVTDLMLAKTIDNEFTTKEDIAEAAAFLAGFPSSAVTGQSLLVSHGWHME